MSGSVSTAVVPGVYERAVALSAQAFGKVVAVARTLLKLGFAASFIAGVAAGLAPTLPLGIAAVLAVLVAYAIAAGIILDDAPLRAAMAIYLDHDRIEAADWRRETGTKRPRTKAAMVRWLRENPDAPNRVSTLVLLGRFAEADRELARKPAMTPDQRFSVASDAQYRVMFTGGTPDLPSLREAWEAIIDPRQRHQRRECLALQEAQAAAAAGGNPIAIMAGASPDVGSVPVRSRAWAFAANGAVLIVLVSGTALLMRQYYLPY